MDWIPSQVEIGKTEDGCSKLHDCHLAFAFASCHVEKAHLHIFPFLYLWISGLLSHSANFLMTRIQLVAIALKSTSHYILFLFTQIRKSSESLDNHISLSCPQSIVKLLCCVVLSRLSVESELLYSSTHLASP